MGAPAGGRLGQRAHAERVHREGPLGIALAAVDVGHRRGVDDRVGGELGDDLLDLLAVGEVERVAARGEHVVARQGLDDPGPDLAGRAGDEDAHGSEVYGAAQRRERLRDRGPRWPGPGSWSWAAARW